MSHIDITLGREGARLPLVGDRGRLRQLAATWQCQGGKCHRLDGEICPPLPPHLSVSVMRAIGQANQHVDWRGPERERERARAPTQKEEPKRGRVGEPAAAPDFHPLIRNTIGAPRTATRSRGGASGRIRWRWIRRFHIPSNRSSAGRIREGCRAMARPALRVGSRDPRKNLERIFLCAAVGFGHLSPNQVCENELAETMQVIGSQRVRERGEEGQGTPAAAAVSRVPLSPLARSLGPCLLLHILRSSGASLSLSPSRSLTAPPGLSARPPAGMERVRHFVRPSSVAAQADGGREGGTDPGETPAAHSMLCCARDPFPFVREISADAMLPPSLDFACLRVHIQAQR